MSSTKDIILNSLEYYDKNNEKYSKLLSRIKYYSQKGKVGDMERHEITFYDKDKKVLFKSDYELIGLYNNFSNTWAWAWSLSWAKKNETYLSRKILYYGLDIVPDISTEFLKAELITSRFRISNMIQLDLHVAIASYLSKMPLTYALHYSPRFTKPDKDNIYPIYDHNELNDNMSDDDEGQQIYYLYLLNYKNILKK